MVTSNDLINAYHCVSSSNYQFISCCIIIQLQEYSIPPLSSPQTSVTKNLDSGETCMGHTSLPSSRAPCDAKYKECDEEGVIFYHSEDLPYDRRRRNIMRNTVFMVNQVITILSLILLLTMNDADC